VDPAMIGRYYAAQTDGLVADARATMESLAEALAASADGVAERRSRWLEDLQAARAQWWAEDSEDALGTGSAGLSPAAIVRRLREVAPDETILIPDAGNPGVWSYLWDIRQTGTYIKPVGFGNMGFAVPAGVAASVIDPT